MAAKESGKKTSANDEIRDLANELEELATNTGKDIVEAATKAKSSVTKVASTAKAAVKSSAKAAKEAAKEATKETSEKASAKAKVIEEKATATAKATAEKVSDAAKKAAKKVSDASAAKKAEIKRTAVVEFAGNQYMVEDVIARCEAKFKADNKKKPYKDIKVYIKPENNAAYYVVDDKSADKIDLI